MPLQLFLVVALCILFRPIRYFFLKATLSRSRRDIRDEHKTATENLAELQGQVWEQISVYAHIEQGLRNNPNGPAVICTFQAASHLEELFKSENYEASSQFQRHQNGTSAGFGHQRIGDVAQHDHKEIASVKSPKTNGFLEGGARTDFESYPVNVDANHRSVPSFQPGHDATEPPNSTEFTWTLSRAPSAFLSVTYTQLDKAALRLAAGLIANGAKPGNGTMLMLIPNGVEYTLLLWTCMLLRITYVSLDPALLDISGFTALKQTLKMLKPQLVVAPDSSSGRCLDVAVAELQLPEPIRLCLETARPGEPRRITGSSLEDWQCLVDIARRAPTTDGTRPHAAIVEAARRDRPSRIHSIMFTSGTSGMPKGCPMRVGGMSHMLHSQSWLIDSDCGALSLQQPHNSRGIAPAQTLQTWKAGGAVVMTGQEFNARDAVEAIRRTGVTFLVLTPPMVHEMASELVARPTSVQSVKKVQVGGDTITQSILMKCAALFPQAHVCVNHGMTEGGGSFVWPFSRTPVSTLSFFGEICPAGAIAPGATVRIWDADKKSVAERDQLGELHISSGSIIKGYVGGKSEESFYHDSQRRWFKTGDVAMMSRQGLVFILGRAKDVIKRGGLPIVPAAVESTIQAFVGGQAVVVSVPHHVLGAEPFAILELYNGKTGGQIKDHVRQVFGRDCGLAGVASLKEIGLAEFPLNQTHKVVKDEVRKRVLEITNSPITMNIPRNRVREVKMAEA